MTFKEQIKKLANSKAYSRGLEIYNKGKILRFQAEENNREEMVLEALVKGSGQNRYSVYLIWDTVQDEMVEADCECPAFREYEGICKHCVAVLLQYYSDSRVKAYREKLEQEKREKLLQIPGVKKGAERKTTEGIRQLLKKSAVVKSLPLIQGDICGKVRLEPHLIVENPSAALHFKIGVDRMYVMKDVFAFARAVERRKSMHTGKIFLSPMQWKALRRRADRWYLLFFAGRRRINIAMATAGIHRIIMALPVPKISCWI